MSIVQLSEAQPQIGHAEAVDAEYATMLIAAGATSYDQASWRQRQTTTELMHDEWSSEASVAHTLPPPYHR
jgi:hypothetical protein